MKTSIIKPASIIAVAFAMAVCFALAGCGGSSSSSAASSSASSESASASASAASSSAASDELSFGKKSDTALSITFKNETGVDIKDLAAVAAVTQGNPVKLMGTGDTLPIGKEAIVYLEPVGAEPFVLTFTSNGKQYTLHNVEFARYDKASIRIENDVAYLTANANGNVVSTLQEEYDVAHPSAAEEEVSDNQSDSQEDVEYYEDDSETEYYDVPDEDYEEAPAQDEDGCVDDIVLN